MSQLRLIHYDLSVPFDALAQNLVNSYDNTHDPPEYLRAPEDLQALLKRHGFKDEQVKPADLKAVRQLRDQVRAVFEARSNRQAIMLLNELLEDTHIGLQVTADEPTIVLEWNSAGSSLAHRLRGAVALNLAFLIERFGLERLRVCIAAPCRDVFVDVSRNGARQYCSVGCANRTRVAQFRERQRQDV